MTAARKVFGSEKAIDHSTFEYKPEAIIYAQNKAAVINLLVICDWIYPIFTSQAMRDWIGDTSIESQLLSAVTGYHLTESELDQVGERVWNLARAIMVREGRTRIDDTIHESYFKRVNGEEAIPMQDFEEAKTRYYHLRGWSKETGWPTREKLEQLGLSDVAEDLGRKKLLGKKT
jgi:aldehyde:ferredoxin oxidoreductase